MGLFSRANFGMIRVMQSIFMASSKMSCTQSKTSVNKFTPRSASNSGSSKGLGEMEMSQLEASGLKYCIEEFSSRSDLCVVSVCCKCRCITILCACDQDTRSKFKEFRALLPSASIKALIALRVCSNLNTELIPQMS
jgi:hypothetical protein